ncbi:MAG: trehalose-phosphatase [Thermomicrobium sp.]|nr:trehalose-phosphatase [Thermomicrobium sp.]
MRDEAGSQRIVERMLAVWALEPAGFLSDFDGTLSPIVPHPDEARPLPIVREALEKLVRSLALVAIVTGRRAEDVARRLSLPGIVVVGNHGAEWFHDGTVRVDTEAEAWLPSVASAYRTLRERLPGLRIEDKAVTLTVHLRGVTDPSLRTEAWTVVHRVAATHGLIVRPGREVLELRPPLALDKGSAVAALVRRYALRGVVFAGDDVTDLDAMRRLGEMRGKEGLQAFLVGVWSDEAPPELARTADDLVDGVETFGRALAAAARRLASS